MRWLVLLLLLTGCVAGHDVTIILDFSGAGALDINRDGGEDGSSLTVSKAPPQHVGSQK